MTRTIQVDLGERSYGVRIGAGLLDELGEVAASLGRVSAVAVVTDSNVGALYGGRAVDSLRAATLSATLIEFPAGEEHKTLATFSKVMDAMLTIEPPIDRDSLVVALGGGVAGDLAGFAAACALRGIRWLGCPTSLLADVDASTGGKTAVDHPTGKNLIGAFHQPSGVLIDVETLRTLPADELRNGLTECVKHAVIRDATLLEYIEDNAADLLACRNELMCELIAMNVAIKAAVVSADERETGQRAHLNFGHTIGHAIEVHAGYGKLSHGQAVSLGMVVACRMAVARGLIEREVAGRVEAVLRRLGLPVKHEGLNADDIWRIMQHDKKARGGQVRMILPVNLGEVAVFSDVTAEQVRRAVETLT